MKKYTILLFVLIIASLKAQEDNTKYENYLSGVSSNNLISVTIGGNFIITGTYPASINERVDQFVTRMFNQAKEKLMLTANSSPKLLPQINKEIAEYSFRDIKLKRADGKEIFLDLEKFRINGDFVNNPYLKNDDILIFSFSDLERNFFSISGGVNRPGKFHFMEGDKLKDAIELADGISKAYENVTKAEINRLSYDGREQKVISVNVFDDYPLQRGDQIKVIADETMKKDFSVTVIGEVKSPGVVPITRDRTTLYEVIHKAGGLTKDASLRDAKLYTGTSFYSLMEKQFSTNKKDYLLNPDFDFNNALVKIEDLKMFRMSNIVSEDTLYFSAENQLRVLTESSSPDFTKLNDSSSEISKYLVKDDDIIIIPTRQNSVYIFGQVQSPGHVPYLKGEDYTYYIDKADGYGDYAEKNDVMIIKGGSRNWIEADKKIVIEEGDYIYIPKKTLKSFNTYISQLGTYLGIVGSAATIILLLLQFKK
jgi:protein involved in polysaccharide export with SLBB domain